MGINDGVPIYYSLAHHHSPVISDGGADEPRENP